METLLCQNCSSTHPPRDCCRKECACNTACLLARSDNQRRERASTKPSAECIETHLSCLASFSKMLWMSCFVGKCHECASPSPNSKNLCYNLFTEQGQLLRLSCVPQLRVLLTRSE